MRTFKEYLNSLQEQGYMRIQAGGQTIEKRGGQTIRDTTRGIDNRPSASPSVPPPATIRTTSTTTRSTPPASTTRTSSPASSSTTTTQTSNQRLRQAQQSAAEVGRATGTSGLTNKATGVSNRMQSYYDRLRGAMRQTGVGGAGANQNMNLRGVPMKNSYELEGEQLQEKSLSKAQQRFFGMVRATQKGEMKAPSSEVAKAASSMKKGDVKDFAKTKHKGLPEKKEVKESSEDRKRDRRQERGGVGANVDYKKPPAKKLSNAELGIKPMTDEQREKRRKEIEAHLKKRRGL